MFLFSLEVAVERAPGLFHSRSSLPWAIFIDPQYRLPQYQYISTYHPLFLYESVWSLFNLFFLIYVGRKYQDRLKSGTIFLLYLIFYGIGRVGLEFLRLDISSFQGININQVFMTVVVLISGFILIRRQKNSQETIEIE